jgi:transposase-like protein
MEQKKLICPHCRNEDVTLMEQIRLQGAKSIAITKYLCNVCSKTFVTSDYYGENK